MPNSISVHSSTTWGKAFASKGDGLVAFSVGSLCGRSCLPKPRKLVPMQSGRKGSEQICVHQRSLRESQKGRQSVITDFERLLIIEPQKQRLHFRCQVQSPARRGCLFCLTGYSCSLKKMFRRTAPRRMNRIASNLLLESSPDDNFPSAGFRRCNDIFH